MSLLLLILLSVGKILSKKANIQNVVPFNITENIVTGDLKFQIEINNIHFWIILKPNYDLVSLHETSDTKNQNKKQFKYKLKDKLKVPCFYHGYVEKVPHSTAAVSVCEGIQGYFSLNDKIYFVEPLRSKENKQTRKRRDMRSLMRTTHQIYESEKRIIDLPSIELIEKLPQKIWREKRSILKELYMEVLVVVDEPFQRFINSLDKSLELYILTLFNMVSNIYKHPSIGVSLQVVVSSFLKLENNQSLEITSNIEETLENFCQFQSHVTDKYTDKRIHDVAVLLTQKPFGSGEGNKTTLGLAKLGGMCEIEASCNVNYHHGLAVAFTIAHEIGHNLNSDHDKDECSDSKNIMQNQIDLNNIYTWSECSRREIINFIDEGRGHCLENIPESLIEDEILDLVALPGTLNSFDSQCKLEHGVNATDCLDIQVHEGQCDKLFCKLNLDADECVANYFVAEGTECVVIGHVDDLRIGRCLKRECVIEQELLHEKPVDGGWSEWTENWSECSHECNGGVQFKERFCSNPSPSNGGKYCLGERKKYQVCNLNKCTHNEDFFKVHLEMCKKIEFSSNFPQDLKNISSLIYAYLPEEPCKLFCSPDNNQTFYIDVSKKLPDGTKCSPNIQDVCINGFCKKVGCDGKLDSDLMYDKCMICNGDNSTCNLKKLEMSINSDTKKHISLFIFPIGSTSISISNDNLGNSFEIKQIESTDLSKKDYEYSYLKLDTEEIFTINGPTTKILGIELREFSSNSNLKVEYYTKKSTLETTTTKAGKFEKSSIWKISEWSNETCAQDPCSMETREVTCADTNCIQDTKPLDRRPCKKPQSIMSNTRREPVASRNEPVLTSVSFSVDSNRNTTSTPGPPSYDYVIKHPNMNQANEIQPPSYDSLYNRVRNAHRTIRNTVRNGHGTGSTSSHKLANVIGGFVIFIFFIIVPILKIIVGITYRDECPINLSIPLWLIIDGIFFILLVISIIFFKYFDCSLLTSVLVVFLVSWLVRGSVWVYGSRKNVKFNPLMTEYYCNPILYDLAFWTITVTWSLVASMIVSFILAVACTKTQNTEENDNS
ncbi:unnamed protein product [Brachionus calyciflorus]|uniref:Peptidase M12B domain-containing protein n=1 Tax=Brachionus calyciflorus TaxID=104777 RepID=A0A814B7S9_9BILA|nr:unnamed protein product [Brachionus calyciflorus]